ncbi:MAG: hypothetical protein IIX23_02680 [Oscillospiraceae bacterium]|nr:hypothetical protein [Oscillospiraceae bacterium]
MSVIHQKLSMLFIILCILLAGCAVLNQQNTIDNNNSQTSLPQSAKLSDIKEGRHYRTEEYAADFKVFTVTTAYGTVHMEQEIFEKGALQDAVLQIEKDLVAITGKIGNALPCPLELYLVEKTISGQPQNGAGRIYCTLQDIGSGTYRQALVAEAYGLTMLWQNIGLCRFIFEEPIDTTSLLKDFTESGHYVSSLFPAYFMPEFCDVDTMQLAQKLSQSVTGTFLQNNSLEEYIRLETAEPAVQLWASKHQLETPVLPEGHKEVSHLKVSHISAKAATIYADSDMNRFRFEIQPTDWIGTAEEYYLFLCQFYDGYVKLLQRMQELLPKSFEQVQKHTNTVTYVRFIHSSGQTKADFLSSEISIGEPGSLWHELCHILLPRDLALNGEDIWLSEGLATWFAAELETQYGMTRRDPMFIYLTDPTAFQDVDPVAMEQQACIVACYEQFASLPATSMDIDAGAFYRACGIITLLRPDLDNRNGLPMNEYSVEGSKRTKRIGKNGNTLTYPETMLAIDYLAEQHGIDMVVSGFLEQVSFDEWYGMTYLQFYKQFVGWVQNQYKNYCP